MVSPTADESAGELLDKNIPSEGEQILPTHDHIADGGPTSSPVISPPDIASIPNANQDSEGDMPSAPVLTRDSEGDEAISGGDMTGEGMGPPSSVGL